jgi:hypothetical protein
MPTYKHWCVLHRCPEGKDWHTLSQWKKFYEQRKALACIDCHSTHIDIL